MTAETELRALQAMSAVDANWSTLARKLQKDLTHHIWEEEGKVLAEAKKLFSDADAKMLNEAFVQLKPIVKKQSLVGASFELIKNYAPGSVTQTVKLDPLKQFTKRENQHL